MTRSDLAALLEFGLVALLAALAALMGYRLLSRPAMLRQLLSPDRAAEGGGGTPADRVQLLVVFALAVGGYVLQAVRLASSGEPLTSLPEAPDSLLVAFAGSQAVYLGGK